MIFICADKRKLIAVLITIALIVVAVVGISVPVVLAANAPKATYVVVIDAGHGGIDGGVVGVKTGTPEAGINLAIAKSLESSFRTAGVRVIMTRNGDAGLYSINSKTPKKDDMRARATTIKNAKPDLMISIHQNAYPTASQRGAQVFYRSKSESSLALASLMQEQLNKSLPASARVAQVGDYYVLNCCACPAVLVECGFLSNAEDEKNLLDEAYQSRVAYQIYIGAMGALANSKKTASNVAPRV